MLFLYTLMLFFLGAVRFLMGRRVASLEKKYYQTAKAADQLLREPLYKGGNSNKLDPCLSAKRQYLLGHLVQKRDRIESRYVAWQKSADQMGRFVTRLGDWKGKKLPYTMGVLDVSFVLCLIDYLGVGHYVNFRDVMQQVAGLFQR